MINEIKPFGYNSSDWAITKSAGTSPATLKLPIGGRTPFANYNFAFLQIFLDNSKSSGVQNVGSPRIKLVFKRIGNKSKILKSCSLGLSSSTQPHSTGFHGVNWTRTATKCAKMKKVQSVQNYSISLLRYANL